MAKLYHTLWLVRWAFVVLIIGTLYNQTTVVYLVVITVNFSFLAYTLIVFFLRGFQASAGAAILAQEVCLTIWSILAFLLF